MIFSFYVICFREPFEEDEDDKRILNSTGHWMSVPFREFDIQTAHLLANLSVKMKTTIKDYKQVSKMMNNRYLTRSRRRSSKVEVSPDMLQWSSR